MKVNSGEQEWQSSEDGQAVNEKSESLALDRLIEGGSSASDGIGTWSNATPSVALGLRFGLSPVSRDASRRRPG